MSISSALQNAISGLAAAGQRAAVTAGNIANAQTPGFAARAVSVTSTVAGGHGTGVAVTGIVRAESPELTATRRIADGDLAGGQAASDALRRLEQALGGPAETDSLANRTTRFEAALRTLAETPELEPRQVAAAVAASDLAAKFNQISTESTRIRQSADDEIARLVTEVNSALTSIARLNRQIQIFAASGRDTSALVDQRESLIDKVAAVIPIRENRREGGVVELTTAQGLALVDTRARQLAFTASPVITPALRYDGGSGALSGLTLDGVDITPGGPGSQAVAGGAIAGHFAVRDMIAPAVSDRADALAAEVIGRLSAPGIDPTLPPGAPGLFTDDGAALDPANITGLAGRLRVNAAVDVGNGGDPSLLRDGLGATAPGPAASPTLPRAMLDAMTAPAGTTAIPGLAGSRSIAEAADMISELTAVERVSAESDVAAFAASRQTLAAAEADRLAVDTDAELQALIQIEQAYAANAQVIQAAARMLDQLIGL